VRLPARKSRTKCTFCFSFCRNLSHQCEIPSLANTIPCERTTHERYSRSDSESLQQIRGPTLSARRESPQSESSGEEHSSDDESAISLPPVDQARIEAAVREILLAVGEDPNRDGLQETPARVARMYTEIFQGLHLDPGRHLKKVFAEQYDEMVLVRDISFNSMCEHHLLPFMGVAHVGYIPRGKVTGLSKLARVVDEVARRPQVQERMTHMIADLIDSELQAKGVIVVIEAEHTCMTIRGVRKPGALTVTSAVRGLFRNNMGSRAEAMALINGK
jgi:GTP cyclohydrolase I